MSKISRRRFTQLLGGASALATTTIVAKNVSADGHSNAVDPESAQAKGLQFVLVSGLSSLHCRRQRRERSVQYFRRRSCSRRSMVYCICCRLIDLKTLTDGEKSPSISPLNIALTGQHKHHPFLAVPLQNNPLNRELNSTTPCGDHCSVQPGHDAQQWPNPHHYWSSQRNWYHHRQLNIVPVVLSLSVCRAYWACRP